MSVHAHPRGAARHHAVHRRAMAARSRRWAIRSTRISKHGDVRLTMGGEPTFVSIDDMDGAEWNTDALGPEKRMLAERLHRPAARAASPRRRCCITGRANGIPANSCRAGRWPATGARTACRSGTTARCSPRGRRRRQLRPLDAQRFSRDAGRAASASTRTTSSRASRIRLLLAARAPAAGQRRSGGQPARRRRRSASGCAASSSAA